MTTPNNRKQAMVPVKGHKIINHHGTAPGAWFEQEGRCAVLMPGVPSEMKAMWNESVRPLLMKRQNCTLHSVTLRVLGGESNLEYQVRDLLENANPTAAIYCKTGECEIRITARAASDAEGEKMCREYAKKFYDLLGDAVYDEDVAGLEETLVRTLKEKGLTLSTAESCTGGLIAQRITSVPGSSEVFGYGFVTYWEAAKARLVGVEPDVIAKYNVVSAPVAAQMALGAAQAAGAEIGISVTGVAGPTGGDALRPVGTVYLGAARGETDQPVQIGIAACSRLEDEPELWTSYIAVEKPVLWSASQVHGITTEMLADAPSFPSLWPEIRSRLGQAVVVGHNPATERKFLRRFPGHGFGPWLDTLALGRMCVPGLEDYSLSSLCGALGLTCSVEALLPARRWHDALYDALASLLIVRFLVKELNLSGQPLEVLGKAVRT